jgi:hypothetical protein
MYFKKLIRKFSLWLEHRTSEWVIPKGTVYLIENTQNPDFESYTKIIEEQKKIWGYDPEIQRAKVRGRLKEFLKENKK